MSNQSEKWDAVHKALAMKGTEAPSKELLQGFSGRVLEKLQQPPPPPTRWQRLGLELEWKPFLACAGGALVVALLTYAVLIALRETRVDSLASVPSGVLPRETSKFPAFGDPSQVSGQPLAPELPSSAASTAPALSVGKKPFNPFKPRADRAGYNVGLGEN